MLDSPKTLPRIRFRQIVDGDVNDVVDLLTRGFAPRRTRAFWHETMARLAAHVTPGAPRYGYMLDDGSRPVGVVLLVSSLVPAGEGTQVRTNVSSWYVDPAFRSYASMLISQAIRHKEVTYVNLTSVAHTRPILLAQGYTCYARGAFIATLPLHTLARAPGARIVPAAATPRASVAPYERQLLLDHAAYGCIALWCETEERAHPFVFRRRSLKGIPCAQLIYCRDVADFVRFAGPIGRYLAWRGKPFVIIDSNGAVPELVGTFRRGSMTKYFKGPQRPRLGDLAFSEYVVLGV